MGINYKDAGVDGKRYEAVRQMKQYVETHTQNVLGGLEDLRFVS